MSWNVLKDFMEIITLGTALNAISRVQPALINSTISALLAEADSISLSAELA